MATFFFSWVKFQHNLFISILMTNIRKSAWTRYSSLRILKFQTPAWFCAFTFQRWTFCAADTGSLALAPRCLLPEAAILTSGCDKRQPSFWTSTCSASGSKFCCFPTAEWFAMSWTACELMSLCVLSLWEFSVTDPHCKQVPDYFFSACSNTTFTASAWSWRRRVHCFFPACHPHWRNLVRLKAFGNQMFFRFPQYDFIS